MRKEILHYYASAIESTRLEQAPFEKIRTQEIISRHLADSRLKILDVGGGAGVYSFWLKQLGHEVHLVDPSLVNIQNARKEQERSGLMLDSILEGIAESISFENESFDMVLLLGPLYHLTKKPDRIRALEETKRVLKKGGKVFAAVISRFASMLDGYSRDLVKDPDFIPIMQQDLENGQHRNPTGNFEYFTTSFFHHPDEIKSEMNEAGFADVQVLPVESFGWLIPSFQEKWVDENFRDLLLKTISSVENDQSILGVSAHLIGIGKKI